MVQSTLFKEFKRAEILGGKMEFPKQIMKLSELKKLGYPEPLLKEAYRDPKQDFATKLNPSKPNSVIIFDTIGFNKWISKRISVQTAEFSSRRRIR